jgi:2-dehydro-3-deoxygalactonokinase
MRGEETQLLGLLHQTPEFDGLACLPGTHSKWARLAGGAVRRFDTYMTGELYAALSAHTVLRHSLAEDGWDTDAFRDQLVAEAANPTPLARGLFSLRARHLLEGAAPAEIRARLSALLIGAELSGALAAAKGRPVRLLAGGALGERYAQALDAFGATFDVTDSGEATLNGLRAARNLTREDI